MNVLNVTMSAVVTFCAVAVALDLKRGENMAAIRDAATLVLVVILCVFVLMDSHEKEVHVDEAPQELVDAPIPTTPPSPPVTTQVADPWDPPASNTNGLDPKIPKNPVSGPPTGKNTAGPDDDISADGGSRWSAADKNRH